MQKKPYSLEDPSEVWDRKFDELKNIMMNVFADKIVSIDHIGSNSYGIKAKPVLDVLVVVKDISDINQEKNEMEKYGYLSQDNYVYENSGFLYKMEDGNKVENIHVLGVGHDKIDQYLISKEYFATHPDALKEYEDLKIRLNKEFPDDYPAYRAAKSDFLQNILRLAREWKNNDC